MSLPSIEQLDPWIDWRFARSSGPGGQNVNKVNTRVTLLLDFEGCDALAVWQKTRIRARLKKRLDRDGRVMVIVSEERSQARNREIAQERLMEWLTEATRRVKARRPTKPTAGSRRRRLEEKKQRSDVKKQRQWRPGE